MDAKQSLRQATLELLKDHMPDDLTVTAIAERSGVNRALVSYHFGGKDRLVDEVASKFIAEKHSQYPHGDILDESPALAIRRMVLEDLSMLGASENDDHRLHKSLMAMVFDRERYPKTASVIRPCAIPLVKCLADNAGRKLDESEESMAMATYMGTLFFSYRTGMDPETIADLTSVMLTRGVGK